MKITFSVVIGNPTEKFYDKMINRYGGRVIGIFKKDTILPDNKLYDLKFYEIFKEDYEKAINKK